MTKSAFYAAGVFCAASLASVLISGNAYAVTACTDVSTTGYSDGICNTRRDSARVFITERVDSLTAETAVTISDGIRWDLTFGH